MHYEKSQCREIVDIHNLGDALALDVDFIWKLFDIFQYYAFIIFDAESLLEHVPYPRMPSAICNWTPYMHETYVIIIVTLDSLEELGRHPGVRLS